MQQKNQKRSTGRRKKNHNTLLNVHTTISSSISLSIGFWIPLGFGVKGTSHLSQFRRVDSGIPFFLAKARLVSLLVAYSAKKCNNLVKFVSYIDGEQKKTVKDKQRSKAEQELRSNAGNYAHKAGVLQGSPFR